MKTPKDDYNFTITYDIDDGYVGGARPHYIKICADDLVGDESDDLLRKIFWEFIEEDFRQNVNPTSKQEEVFLLWAKRKQKELS